MNRTKAEQFSGNVDKIVRLARKHLTNAIQESSARFCMEDAVKALDRGDRTAATMWALKSLEYSIGVNHPEFPAR